MVRARGRPEVRSRLSRTRALRRSTIWSRDSVSVGILWRPPRPSRTTRPSHPDHRPIQLKRDLRSLPEVPTLEESGFPSLTVGSWYAAFVPLGTPAPVIARLNAAANKAVADPGTREQFLTSATEPVGGTPEDLAREARRFREVRAADQPGFEYQDELARGSPAPLAHLLGLAERSEKPNHAPATPSLPFSSIARRASLLINTDQRVADDQQQKPRAELAPLTIAQPLRWLG